MGLGNLLFDLLFFAVRGTIIFIIAKLLIWHWKWHFKEVAYILFAALIIALGSITPQFGVHIFIAQGFVTTSIGLLLFFYFFVIAFRPVKQSIALAIEVLFAQFMAMFFLPYLLLLFFPSLAYLSEPWRALFRLSMYIPAAAIAFVCEKISVITHETYRKKESRFLVLDLIAAGVVIASFLYNQINEHSKLINITVAVVVCTYLIIYIMTRMIKASREQHRKEEEQRNLQNYIDEMEQQQIGIRKFRHDYQNILLSLDNYIEAGDLEGLQKYYSETIKGATEIIYRDDFALTNINKIKVREIKSILTSKIMMAQNLGINVKTTFEANEELTDFSVDSVALVRMLGILLDNAIEAIEELILSGEGGDLYVGIFKWKGGVTFIIENTCSSACPPLGKIWEMGYSTKSEGRGLGLANLSELVSAYPNITLGTVVKDGKFRQELLIEEVDQKRNYIF